MSNIGLPNGLKMSNDQCTIRGERFAEVSETSREQIAQLGHCFVRDGAVVLTHGYSRCALQLLLMAAETKVCVYAHARQGCWLVVAVLYHRLVLFRAEKPRSDGIFGAGSPCIAVFGLFSNYCLGGTILYDIF